VRLFYAYQLLLFCKEGTLLQSLLQKGNLLLFFGPIHKDRPMSTLANSYLRVEIRFKISLLFYIIAIFLLIVWKPTEEY